jgi:hypothetical protein
VSRSSLLDRWLSRLGRDSAIDLVERGREIVPELLEVYTPTDFELRLLDGSWLRALDGEVMVELTAELLPLGLAGETGVVERRLDTASRHVHHDKLELPSPAQGVGRGRAMLRQSVDLYVELGIERVSLLAVDTGRYVWAAAGFSFLDDEARTGVVGAIDDAAELLDLGSRTSILRAANRGRLRFFPRSPTSRSAMPSRSSHRACLSEPATPPISSNSRWRDRGRCFS